MNGNAVQLPCQRKKRYSYRLRDCTRFHKLEVPGLRGCAMHGTSYISRLAEIVSARDLPPPPLEVVLPPSDDAEAADVQEVGYAEGQTFMIEYRSATGEISRRRITVHNIGLSTSRVPILSAFCHERKARRSFRVDRIVCCIDLNGEIFEDVPRFMAESFGMSPGLAAAHEDQDERDRWGAVRNFIRPEAILLAAMTRSDGIVRNVEIETGAEILALSAERAGHMCDELICDLIGRYLLRLRPSEEQIGSAIERIAERAPDEIKRILIAAARVMDSDEDRHPQEIAVLNAMARELIGANIL